MMARQKRTEPTKQFSVKFPMEMVEEIDTICSSNYIPRSSWIISACKEKLERDRSKKKMELMDKLAGIES